MSKVDEKAFSGKTTFMAVWAGSGNCYNMIECCDLTYERRIAANFDELDAEKNRELATKCARMLNDEHEAAKASEQGGELSWYLRNLFHEKINSICEDEAHAMDCADKIVALIQEHWPTKRESVAPAVDKGRHSEHPCAKCGAHEVYVTEINDYPDYEITCYGCNHSYKVDRPDA